MTKANTETLTSGVDMDTLAKEAQKAVDNQYDKSKEFLSSAWDKISTGLTTDKEYLERLNSSVESSIHHSVDVNKQWIEFFHDMISERIAVSANVMRIREPKEQIELELEFARSSFTNYIDISQKIFAETKEAIEKTVKSAEK